MQASCQPQLPLSFASRHFLCVGQTLRHSRGRYIYTLKWLKLQKQIIVGRVCREQTINLPQHQIKLWDECFLHFPIHLYSSRKYMDLKETILPAITEIHFNKLQLGVFLFKSCITVFFFNFCFASYSTVCVPLMRRQLLKLKALIKCSL